MRGKGEGSIEQLPSGKFRAIISAGRGPDGRRNKLSFTADTRKECQTWLREKLGDKDSGRLARSGRLLLSEWLERWLQAKKLTVEPNTYRVYEVHVRRHIRPRDLSGMQLAKLTRLDVEAFYADRAEKPLKGDAIAGRLGRKNDGNLRGAISKLMRDGRIRRVDRGYCLPAPRDLAA